MIRTSKYAHEIPVFWPCGVTPQAVAERARVELMITHEPAQMACRFGLSRRTGETLITRGNRDYG
jgi:hypothetical protein